MATCDFRVANFDISKGHVGGWIEKRENLQGKARVDDDAMVYDDAVVSGDAFVCHNARVHGANLFDHVIIQDNAEIGQGSEIFGDITLGSGVKITGYIGHDTVIKTKV